MWLLSHIAIIIYHSKYLWCCDCVCVIIRNSIRVVRRNWRENESSWKGRSNCCFTIRIIVRLRCMLGMKRYARLSKKRIKWMRELSHIRRIGRSKLCWLFVRSFGVFSPKGRNCVLMVLLYYWVDWLCVITSIKTTKDGLSRCSRRVRRALSAVILKSQGIFGRI